MPHSQMRPPSTSICAPSLHGSTLALLLDVLFLLSSCLFFCSDVHNNTFLWLSVSPPHHPSLLSAPPPLVFLTPVNSTRVHPTVASKTKTKMEARVGGNFTVSWCVRIVCEESRDADEKRSQCVCGKQSMNFSTGNSSAISALLDGSQYLRSLRPVTSG